jgi:hypothetical protein
MVSIAFSSASETIGFGAGAGATRAPLRTALRGWRLGHGIMVVEVLVGLFSGSELSPVRSIIRLVIYAYVGF